MGGRRRQCGLGLCLLAQRSRRLVAAGREQHDARSAPRLSVFGFQIRPLARAQQHRRVQLWGKQSREWRPGRGATFVRGRGVSSSLSRPWPRSSWLPNSLASDGRIARTRFTPPRISAPAWGRGLFALLRARALHPRNDRHALIPCFHVQFGTQSPIAGGLADRIRTALRFSDLRDDMCIPTALRAKRSPRNHRICRIIRRVGDTNVALMVVTSITQPGPVSRLGHVSSAALSPPISDGSIR